MQPTSSDADPLHWIVRPDTYWTTVNMSEAVPGVVSPLTATFWIGSSDGATRRAYHRMGVFPRKLASVPTDPSERSAAVFFGRGAMSPDMARLVGDLTPGVTGDQVEQQAFGGPKRDLPSRSTNRRLPFVVTKSGWQKATIRRQIQRDLAASRARWEQHTRGAAPRTWQDAGQLIAQARTWFEDTLTAHAVASMFGSIEAGKVMGIAAERGRADLAADLTTGLGEMEEVGLMERLADVAAGRAPLAGFVDQYGFHGSLGGHLESVSWREDASELSSVLDRYRTLAAAEHPRVVVTQRTERRRVATAELLSLAPTRRARRKVRASTKAVERLVPLREMGKASFLMSIDIARWAAHHAGADLVRQGVVRDAFDVFYLTVNELAGALPSDVAAVVEDRRTRRAQYETTVLPTFWYGVPEPQAAAPSEQLAHGGTLTGRGVSSGVVEGTVRVAHDLNEAFAVEPGEILVCALTDPAWTAVFPIVGGLVTDIGSYISHAAIVAREYGLPCVVGAETATRQLATGMRVRIDGSTGEVRVLAAGT